MEYKTIIYSEKDSIAEVILSRPEKRNSLNDVMMEELTYVFLEINKNEKVKAVVLSGAGNNFCSGMDLEYLKKISGYDMEENNVDSRRFKEMLLSIFECSKPIIAKVSGYAVAGGCGIATCCDFILADESAKFGYPEVQIGFVPAIVMPFLLKRVSETYAKELMLSARIINANESLRMGLINMMVNADKLEDEVNNLCGVLSKNSSGSMAVTKELFRKLSGMNFDEGLEYASKLNASVRMTEDFKKGINNFLEQRKKK